MEQRLKKTQPFDPGTFFIDAARKTKSLLDYREKQTIYSQGDSADAVYYIVKGKVKLMVTSKQKKEAVIAILDPGNFFGESCMVAGQPLRISAATALEQCSIAAVKKTAMVRLLKDVRFSEWFTAYLLSRNLRIQEDLIDQLFNSSEKRLARALLLLSHFGKEGKPELVTPRVSQETLAAMIGTTRARVNFFLNKFRDLGFIDYNGGMLVHNSLLNVVLHDGE
jgi:CRP/FNR family cyclic AMP-dependent transcriptional regulator